MSNEQSIILHLDSRFATEYIETDLSGNPLTTNFTYTLVEAMSIPEDKVCEVSLYTATIPYSFYNIRPGVNDTFTIKMTMSDGTGPHTETYTIPPGNYSTNALKTQFSTLQKASTNAHIAALNFVITYVRETLTFTFRMDTTVIDLHALTLKFDNSAAMFGFRNRSLEYVFSSSPTDTHPNGLALTSEICVDMSDSIHGLYIRQNLATKSTLDNEAGTFSNILTRVPINTNPGGIIFHNPSDSTHRAVTDLHSIQTIGVKLTDDNNRSINLNGLHWQMSLLITLIDRPTVNNFARFSRRVMREMDLQRELANLSIPPSPRKRKKRKKKAKRKPKK